MTKTCDFCGEPMVRKQYGTRMESERAYQTRRFCNASCWGKMRGNRPLSKTMARKRSQSLYPAVPPCEECGATERVQRHHKDYQKPEDIRFLCQACHTRIEHEQGTWGPGPKTPKTCPICGIQFTHYTHTRNQTCSKECLSELGRRNAMKRWGKAGDPDPE